MPAVRATVGTNMKTIDRYDPDQVRAAYDIV